jgi:hypothetical protein
MMAKGMSPYHQSRTARVNAMRTAPMKSFQAA